MLKPAHIETLAYFYPAGNTPAVCYSQTLPPGQDAALLLLGCGDVRSVLFTAYSRSTADASKFDITCCDIEAEIIARNLLLYTLLLDDLNGKSSDIIWNVYYHTKLDSESLNLLRTQASKLESLATSMEEWHKGQYGKLLRFCDTSTFARVVRLWGYYALSPSHGGAYREQQKQLKVVFKKAHSLHKEMVGNRVVLSGIRSAAPCSVLAFKDVPNFLTDYWKNGVAITDKQILVDSKHLNPMFGGHHQTLTLHYGTDPFLGFHLATGYTPLAKDSPLRPEPSTIKGLNTAAQAVIAEFQAWGESFRRASGHLIIPNRNNRTAHAYSDRWHYKPLVLDSEDYFREGSAPIVFDVIDTSNLLDHLGSLNILAACAPLLAPKASSAISTEILVLRDKSIEEYTKGLLCGDLPTVSLLFGLKPVQYWTNTTTFSTFNESMMTSMAAEKSLNTQSRYIMVWRKTAPSAIKFDSNELACFVYNMYLQMFQDESWSNRFSTDPTQLFRNQYERYTRASLAAILRLIRNAQCIFCDKVLNDQQLNMGGHYIQELYTHLHLFGLRTEVPYEPDMSGIRRNLKDSPLRHWKSIKSTVFLTFSIPHHKLAAFQNKSPSKIGSPICHIMLQSPYDGRQNIFPDLQMGFGDIQTTGTKYTDEFAIHAESDQKEWQGNKPLIVSVLVPTWIVLYHADLSTQVIFALKSTPTSMMLAGELGMFLEIHKSALTGKDVFLTQDPPNLEAYVPLPDNPKDYGSTPAELVQYGASVTGLSDLKAPNVTFHVLLDKKATHMSKLNVHTDLASTNGKDLLSSGAVVNVKQLSPFRVEFDIGSGSFCQEIQLPVPLTMSSGKTRSARKSCYVEFIATVASPASLLSRTDSTFKFLFQQGTPILESLPYTNLDCLPMLDLARSSKLEWMTAHLSAMFSARERSKRELHRALSTACDNAQVNFKDSLLSMFSHMAGIGGASRKTVFGIDNRTAGGIQMLIFASSVRLDLASQSIAIDAALLPLTTQLVPRLASFLTHLHNVGIVSIIVDDAELVLWKHAVPAYIERCRDWKHAASCEYSVNSAIPLSTKPGEQFLCSCSMGKFPERHKPKVPLWDSVAKLCVHVAITPCFPVPFVDESVDLGALLTEGAVRQTAQSMSSLDLDKEACFTCDRKEGLGGQPLLKCGKCKVARYCSKECQIKAWTEGEHKRICKTLAAKRLEN
ncbi:hypothetical protein GQ44DRAFT_744204 [Phaeosphaeriaceae sp. PMI808]|nr:hypothetical protein GQ44DRAFT_744204 [Phaeosphaeriaceae sp. PMI808]